MFKAFFPLSLRGTFLAPRFSFKINIYVIQWITEETWIADSEQYWFGHLILTILKNFRTHEFIFFGFWILSDARFLLFRQLTCMYPTPRTGAGMVLSICFFVCFHASFSFQMYVFQTVGAPSFATGFWPLCLHRGMRQTTFARTSAKARWTS